MKKIGDISQVGGLRRYEMLDGRSKGVEAVEVKTGSGFSFTVLPGRGLDIAWGEHKGTNLTHITKNGVIGHEYYDKEGLEWLRTFFGGILTTCGLSNVGWPSAEKNEFFGFDQSFGLHDRLNVTPAENLSVKQSWEKDKFKMNISGAMKETCFKGENLTLARELTAVLGENKFRICDRVENGTAISMPIMLLYHFNFGYPLLDKGTKLIINSEAIIPEDETAKKGLKKYADYGALSRSYPDQVFHHNVNAAKAGACKVAIINQKLKLGVYIAYNKKQLPYFAQWKVLKGGDYITGLEPANCYAEGRIAAKKNNRLEMLGSGKVKEIDIEYGIIEGSAQIKKIIKEIKG